ncbi:MAG: hypothetical protein ACT452_17425 [Microthrixaceae bacterium]
MSRPRLAAICAALWALGTVAALLITLPYVQPGVDFDGLNNMFQVPFALPWFLLLTGSNDHVRDTWMLAGVGLVNSAIIYCAIRFRRPRDLTSSSPQGRH